MYTYKERYLQLGDRIRLYTVETTVVLTGQNLVTARRVLLVQQLESQTSLDSPACVSVNLFRLLVARVLNGCLCTGNLWDHTIHAGTYLDLEQN